MLHWKSFKPEHEEDRSNVDYSLAVHLADLKKLLNKKNVTNMLHLHKSYGLKRTDAKLRSA